MKQESPASQGGGRFKKPVYRSIEEVVRDKRIHDSGSAFKKPGRLCISQAFFIKRQFFFLVFSKYHSEIPKSNMRKFRSLIYGNSEVKQGDNPKFYFSSPIAFTDSCSALQLCSRINRNTSSYCSRAGDRMAFRSASDKGLYNPASKNLFSVSTSISNG